MTILSMNCVPYAIFTYYHLGHSITKKRWLLGYLHYVHHGLTVYPYHVLTITFALRKGALFQSKASIVVIICAYVALLMDHVTTIVAIRKMFYSLTKTENLSQRFVGAWIALSGGDNDQYASLIASDEDQGTKWQKAIHATVKTKKRL